MPYPRPSRTAATPRPTGSPPATPNPNGLNATLDKLRAVLERMAGPGNSPVGSALAGVGANASTSGGLLGIDPIGAAQLGMAPVQVLARRIQQSLATTAAAFDSSLTHSQQVWRRSVGGFASDFFQAFRGQTRRRKGWGIAAGRAGRRAYRAAVDLARHQIKATRRKTRSWMKAARQTASRAAGMFRWGPQRRWRSSRSRRGQSPRWMMAARRWATSWAKTARQQRRSWTKATRRQAQAWTKATRRRWRSWATSAGRGWKRAQRQASRWGRSAARRWRSARRGFGRWARNRWRSARFSGRRWGRRMATARRRANSTYGRTRSVGRAFRAGARALVGPTLFNKLASIASWGNPLTYVRELSNSIRHIFESQNASNARLAHYSPELSQAMYRLRLGDMSRDLRMARETGASAAALADITNRSREIQGSFDRLGTGIWNRVAGATGAVWNAMAAPWAPVADGMNAAMNRFDPQGNLLARVAVSPFSASAGFGGFFGALFTNGLNIKEALDEADRAFKAQEKALLAGKPIPLDPGAYFVQNAPNLKPMRPMKPLDRI